jgi:patatin-like phospholipase/acyl hydrolase
MNNKNVLVLDGGGGRGFFTYALLERLQTSLPKKKMLSDHFDLIVGVSVGALVGALVATKQMDTGSVFTRETIQRNIGDIFRQRTKLGPMLSPMFDGVGKTATCQRIFGDLTLGEVDVPLAIVACRLDGSAKIFKSWEKEDQGYYLSEVLDASSAAPVIFPPVFIEKIGWMTDGGVVSNKPLLITFLIAMDFFNVPQESFRLFSIGTKTTKSFTIDQNLATDLGLLTWLSAGLLDMVTGVNDDTAEKLMMLLLGKDRYLRVSNATVFEMQDVRASVLQNLQDAADHTWMNNGTSILRFLA